MSDVKIKNIYAAGIMLLMAVCALCSTTQGVLLTDYINFYKLESTQQGMMSAFQSAGNIAALFLIGLFIGKTKKMYIIGISAFIIPLVFFILGQKPSYGILLSSYMVYGVAFGFLDSLSSSSMADLYKENSSKAINLLHGVFGLGGLTGPLLLQLLQSRNMEWFHILSFLSVVSLIIGIVYVATAVPALKAGVAASGKEEPITLSGIISFFKQRHKQVLLICSFLYGAHQIGMVVWMTRYISEYLNAPQYGALALSLIWVGATLSRLALTQFRLDPVKVICGGHLLAALSITIGIFYGDGFVMMICCGISGFFEGTLLPLVVFLGCQWSDGNTALGSSMVFFTHYIGFTIASPIIGYTISSFGVTAGMMIPAFASYLAAILAVYLLKLKNALPQTDI